MTRLFRVAAGCLLLVFAAPAYLEAGLLSWLDRLSGPGPFWGIDFGIALKCPSPPPPCRDPTCQGVAQTTSSVRVSCPGERLDKKHFNYYFNVGVAGTTRNKLNYGDRPEPEPSTAIGLVRIGSSVDYTLDPSLDVGAGAGFMYFGGESFDNSARPYVQPLRISIRPLLLNWSPQPFRNDCNYTEKLRRRGWFIITFDLNLVVGTLDGASFGAPADLWRAHNEIVPEFGVSIDVVKLLARSK